MQVQAVVSAPLSLWDLYMIILFHVLAVQGTMAHHMTFLTTYTERAG